MARSEEGQRAGSPEPIGNGDGFRDAVERESGERWAVLEHLAAMTGILAGPDGPDSFGILCARCGFGFRCEAPASVIRDRFAHEARARACDHWPAYLDHPAAFFGEV